MKSKLSWKPVNRGLIYCSPACGAGCTRAGFLLVTKKATALAKALGKNWKPAVSENLGWHYCARLNNCSVWPITSGFQASVYFGNSQFIATSRSPRSAVAKVLKAGREQVRAMAGDLFDFGSKLEY